MRGPRDDGLEDRPRGAGEQAGLRFALDIVGRAFFDAVLSQARDAALLSDDHFAVDGT